ncbi:hypothetical protein HID58_055478, partial [Brassica napus]
MYLQSNLRHYSEKSLRSNNGIEEMSRDQCNWAINGVQKPKSYAAPAGDPGIGLEQLELMCKLYGNKEASAIKVKTFNIEGSSYLSRKKKSGQKKKSDDE